MDSLVQKVLLEEKKAEASFTYKKSGHTLKWTFDNQLDLVFIAGYLNIGGQITYVEDLLKAVKKAFCSAHADAVKNGDRAEFEKQYQSILEDVEMKALFGKANKGPKKPRAFAETKKAETVDEITSKASKKKKKKQEEAEENAENAANDADEEEDEDEEETKGEGTGGEDGFVLEGFKPLAKKGPKTMRSFSKKKSTPKKSTKKNSKKPQKWGEEDDFDADEWDTSIPTPQLSPKEIKSYSAETFEQVSDSEDEEAEPSKSGVLGFFSSIVGGKELTEETLSPVLEQLSTNLMSKNVAADIAESLCDSVKQSLKGKKIGTFSSVKSIVKDNIEQALTRILTPKRSVDVLQGIMAAKEQKRPYTITFVGVNGVGKSTSLSKVCAYILSKGFTVSIAACDTFRAGAVEQLRTHANALGVNVYEKGYNKDAAAVAFDATREAKKNGTDVVLIDTAGRMQNDEPLMRALSKLINLNKPDLVLFVGEALVGNDAVDQLSKFNRCLEDLSTDEEPRLIDGIILSKFDTVDDKVGSAISMTYTTGQPIMFVGTGQDYGDLKKMNPKILIKALLK